MDDTPPEREAREFLDVPTPLRSSMPSSASLMRLGTLNPRRNAWQQRWDKHVEDVKAGEFRSLQIRAESWHQLNNEYQELHSDAKTPPRTYSEKSLSTLQVTDKRWEKELENYSALTAEKGELDRLMKEADLGGIEGWIRERPEELTQEQQAPLSAAELNVRLEGLSKRIVILQKNIEMVSADEQTFQEQLDELRRQPQAVTTHSQELDDLHARRNYLNYGAEHGTIPEDERNELPIIEEQLREAVANQLHVRESRLQVSLANIRGTVENWSGGQSGTRETYMHELRQLREQQRATLEKLAQLASNPPEENSSPIDLESVNRRLEAAREVERKELIALFQTSHQIRQTWAMEQRPMLSKAVEFLNSHSELTTLHHQASNQLESLTTLIDTEAAISTRLNQAMDTAALEALESNEAQQSGGTIHVYRQLQSSGFRPILSASTLSDRWLSRTALEEADHQALAADIKTFCNSQIDGLSAMKRIPAHLREELTELRNALDARRVALGSIDNSNGWPHALNNHYESLRDQIDLNIEHLKRSESSVDEYKHDAEMLHGVPPPTNIPALQQWLIDCLKFENQTQQSFSAQIRARQNAIEPLHQHFQRLVDQQNRFQTIESLRMDAQQNEERANALKGWGGSFVQDDADDYAISSLEQVTALEGITMETIDFLGSLPHAIQSVVEAETAHLDSQIAGIRLDIQETSADLDELETSRLQERLKRLTSLSQQFSPDRNYSERTTQIRTFIEQRSNNAEHENKIPQHTLTTLKRLNDDLNSHGPESEHLLGQLETWQRDTHNLQLRDRDANTRKVDLTDVRKLLDDHSKLRKQYSSLLRSVDTLTDRQQLIASHLQRHSKLTEMEAVLREQQVEVNLLAKDTSEHIQAKLSDLAKEVQDAIEEISSLQIVELHLFAPEQQSSQIISKHDRAERRVPRAFKKTAKLTEKFDAIKNLKDNLDTARFTLVQHEQTLKVLEKRSSHLQITGDDLKDTAATTANEKMQDMRVVLKDLQKSVAKAESIEQLDSVKKEISHFGAQLTTTQGEIATALSTRQDDLQRQLHTSDQIFLGAVGVLRQDFVRPVSDQLNTAQHSTGPSHSIP